MIFSIFSTAFDDEYEHTNDLIFEYEYDGINDVPYLSQGMSLGAGAGGGINYLILAIDECNDVIMGGIVVYVGNNETLNGTGAKSWISSVGVHPSFQGKGVSRFLINEFFDFCSKEQIGKVEQSSYTEMGAERIRHIFEEVSEYYPDVEYIDVLNIDQNNYCVSIE
jgi:GNAT superfamily N-acetyltransferase